jgi:hypothetical protein
MRRTIVAWLAVLAAACGGGDARDDEVRAAQELHFVPIEQAQQSGVREERFAVVRDDAAWRALWDEHKRFFAPPPPPPAVDFTREMVIAVFLGERPNLCYAVAIEAIRAAAALLVEYREHAPPPAALCGAALSFPAHLVRLQRSAAPVQFVKRD